ncbi:hypothetical protein ATANTOWER_008956 [Ataeniobius toweri]|uniref:Uncharacterized protein n=1 Tax=Ataeniobius toweri TaxID=208326 RepID=A0ABU7C8R1_9TELE|nr:hypothetical protein [Ataeniobius toweri]
MLSVRAVEEAGARPLNGGFASCDEPDWIMLLSRPVDMYSAALLLMLAVRICADGVERPTGKQTGGEKDSWKVSKFAVRLESHSLTSPLPASLCVIQCFP